MSNVTKQPRSFLRDMMAASGQKGLSLMEILIALTILGIAGTFITMKVTGALKEGQRRSAQIQLQNLKAALEDYRRHCNRYPTTEQGLDALIQKPSSGPECKRYRNGGYIEDGKVPVDPWDHEFVYEANPEGNKIVTLKSIGSGGGDEGSESEEITLDTQI